MNELLLQFIILLHILFILFDVVAPFTNYTFLLLIHAVIVPFMMLHWVTNNNICALTVMEQHIRGQLYGEENATKDDCFTCKLIEPVYDFTNDKGSLTLYIYLVTLALWFVTLYKLYWKYVNGNFTSLFDFIAQ